MSGSLRNPTRFAIPLAALLVAYLALALAYNAVTRLNYAPDEPWHYKYVESIALRSQIPSLAETHQAQHPPLYYALAALWYRVGALVLQGDALEHWVRFLSAVLGVGILLLIFALAREFLPDRPLAQIATLAASAFLPLFTYLSGAVNNDPLNILLFTAVLLALVRGCHSGFSTKRAASLGVLSGLGLLTKESALAAVPLCLVVIFWDARARKTPLSLLAKSLGAYIVAAALVSGWWFARNLYFFGSFFIHATAKEAQQNAGDILAYFIAKPDFLLALLRQTVAMSLPAFVWPFWIMRKFLPPPTLLAIAVAAVLLVALGLLLARRNRESPPSPENARAAWALALAAILLALGILRYVLFVDWTALEGGRYMLPVLGPIALATVAGFSGLAGRSVRARSLLWSLLIALFLIGDVVFLVLTHFFYSRGLG